MTIDPTRALELAAEMERCDGEMTRRPWRESLPDSRRIYGDIEHPQGPVDIAEFFEESMAADASGIATLRNLAPEVAATIRGLVEECERMRAIVDDELRIEELARICDDPKTSNEQFERANDARFFATQRRLAAVDAYRRSKP